jgi:membrane protease YdiL (CAAX protease family)
VFYAIIYLRAGLLFSILFHFLANLIPEFRDTVVPQYIACIALAITCVSLPMLLLERRFRRKVVKKS